MMSSARQAACTWPKCAHGHGAGPTDPLPPRHLELGRVSTFSITNAVLALLRVLMRLRRPEIDDSATPEALPGGLAVLKGSTGGGRPGSGVTLRE